MPKREPDAVRIAREIGEVIAAGRLKPGERLPSHRDLADTYGVSRSTVQRALKLLDEQGLVEGQQGKAVFVAAGGVPTVFPSLSVVSTGVDELVPVTCGGAGGTRTRDRGIMRASLIVGVSAGRTPVTCGNPNGLLRNMTVRDGLRQLRTAPVCPRGTRPATVPR